MSDKQIVTIYTDGGCIGNPGDGGWAALLIFGEHRKTISGRFRETTNNRMEMRAAIEALEALTRPCPVHLYTDSTYLRNGITKWVFKWQKNGWKTGSKNPVKNRDLWESLLQATAHHQPAGGVEWFWTKGHAGDEGNEEVDGLANAAANNVTDDDPVDEQVTEFSDSPLSLFSP